MRNKFLYSCYLLTEDSKRQLLTWLYENKVVGHSTQYLHHCTIEFGSDTIVDDSMVGQSAELSVIGYCKDEYAAAFIVNNYKEVMSVNAHPHITESCADGVKPFYSNKMIARPMTELEIKWFAEPIAIKTVITKIYAE